MEIRRTDLALEARELWQERSGDPGELAGVRSCQGRVEGYGVTRVEILDAGGAEALGKPAGRYHTVDLTEYWERRRDFFPRAVRAVGGELRALLPEGGTALVAGIGNPDMAPDAVGPLTAASVLATRHLTDVPGLMGGLRPVAVFRTGVLGSTGVETAEAVRGLADRIRPGFIIAVDALAARKSARLCNTVQISDTGIAPGSGVGNHRAALDQSTLGIPVIAVGLPTVMDAATLCADLREEAGRGGPAGERANRRTGKPSGKEPGAGTENRAEDDPEERAALSELLRRHGGFVVTPRDVESRVREAARVIGYAVNWALHDLEIAEISALLP